MRLRRAGQLAVAGAALLILASAFAGAAGAAPEEPTGDTAADVETANPDAPQYAQDFGVSLKEAERRLALQVKVPAFEELVAEQAGDDFGGVWIEHEPEFRVVVGLTEGAPRPAALDGSEALKDVVEVETVEYSQDVLREARKAAETELDAATIGYDSFLDITKNNAVIEVAEEIPTTLAALDKASGAVDIERVAGLAQPEDEFYGGLAGSQCTMGFVVIDERLDRRAITTAGHCPNDQTVKGSILPFERDYFSGHLDLQINRVAIADDLPARVKDGKGSGETRAIRGTDRASVGSVVCKYGKRSYYGCGTVTTTTASLSFIPNSRNSFVGVGRGGESLTEGGDSGAPWFLSSNAWGIHAASNDNKTRSYYTPVRYLDIANAHVATPH